MKFIFVSDLHSNRVLYDDLENLIYAAKPDALIIGGDIFTYSTTAKPQLDFAKECLLNFINKINIPVYVISGNCDRPLTVEYLKEMQSYGLLHILNLHGTIINNIEFIGYEYTQPNPFKIKDWEKRDLISDDIFFEYPCFISNCDDELKPVSGNFLNSIPSIEEDLNLLKNKKAIWVMHTPPFGGVLDINYKNIHGGSTAVRKAIERVQPILTLHGHIHESPSISNNWYEKIGNTISINPGSSELLQGVIFEIDDEGTILSITHTLYDTLNI